MGRSQATNICAHIIGVPAGGKLIDNVVAENRFDSPSIL
jgi:hypothetical protein